MHKGGATCFDPNGCDPSDFRLCGKTNIFTQITHAWLAIYALSE